MPRSAKFIEIWQKVARQPLGCSKVRFKTNQLTAFFNENQNKNENANERKWTQKTKTKWKVR